MSTHFPVFFACNMPPGQLGWKEAVTPKTAYWHIWMVYTCLLAAPTSRMRYPAHRDKVLV